MRRFERRLRLATGLIIACFVVGHFLNHSLGVVSIDAMDRLRSVLSAWWRSPAGTVLLYGSQYWKEIINFDALVRHGTISPEDLKLFSFVDDPAAALRLLQKGLRAQPEEEPPAFAHSRAPQRKHG